MNLPSNSNSGISSGLSLNSPNANHKFTEFSSIKTANFKNGLAGIIEE